MVIRILVGLLTAPGLHLLIEIAGLAALVAAAFLFHLVAGVAALGVALLIVAALLEAHAARAQRVER